MIYNQPPTGSYGGGRIELLMTGRNPAPVSRECFHAATPPVDVFGQPQAPRAQITAPPPGSSGVDEIGVGRAIDPRYRRQIVSWRGPHAPGTVVIQQFSFWVLAG